MNTMPRRASERRGGHQHGVLRHLRAAVGVAMLLAVAVAAAGCGYYSLTGASIPSHIQTIAIPLAEDRTVGAPAGLDQRLTDFLIDRFTGRTRLVLVQDENDADAVLTAVIERYTTQPAAVTGQEVAALNRINLSVRVEYRDRVEDRERLARVFTGREDYDATQVDREPLAAETALRQIAEDIFTAATSDW
jgi:hypothetical protein